MTTEHRSTESTPSAIKLVAFDLDGTLLRGATVSEVIARSLGRVDRMRALDPVRELEAWQAAVAEMAGWYTLYTNAQLCSSLSSCQLALGVDDAFELLRRHGIATAIVSMTWEFAVAWFVEQFKADYYLGTRILPDQEIVHVWPETKADFVARVASDRGITPEQIAAVGDSWGNVPMLRGVGLPIFVGHQPPVELPGMVHLPDADMVDVAHCILNHA